MIADLLLPGLVMGLLGFFVPRWLFPHFPEGVAPLMRLAATSIAIMVVVSTLAFVAAYVGQDIPVGILFEESLVGGT